ncbi:hypothetical protein ES707_07555 [subsurface metagenome]
MPADYERLVSIQGEFEEKPKTVAVDEEGQMYTLMVGRDGNVIAIDSEGGMRSVMQGQFNTTPKTLLTDKDGRMLAQLMGMYGTEPVPISCDSAGRLTIVGLDQTNISADPNEGQTWDVSLGTLLNNLNRIRYMVVTITGEAWGTVSHSLTDIWAKFHATTGHKHTAVAGDGPQLDHGQLGGLTDDDHARYFDKNGKKPITGRFIKRDVNDSDIVITGGLAVGGGHGAYIQFYGRDAAGAGSISFTVPNAAKTGAVSVFTVSGNTDDPVTSFRGFRVAEVKNPTFAQDVATKNYVDTSAIAKTGFVLLWSGSIATIPTGWVLCNGGSLTPDLRDKFVVGAGSTYAVDAIGGEATHTLTVDEIPSHLHDIHLISGTILDAAATYEFTSGAGDSVGPTCYTGGDGAHENRPPYYALAYIMKT